MVSRWKNLCDLNFSRYSVSRDGLVYDHNRGKLMKQQLSTDGYSVTTIRDDWGNRKTMRVHRLVALVFIPNPESKETVNHMDGIKTHNHVENLEWATRSENTQHAWDNGLIKDKEGRKKAIREKQGRPVICMNDGRRFNSCGEAGELLGLQSTNIHAVCSKKKGFKTAGKDEDGNGLIWRFEDEL